MEKLLVRRDFLNIMRLFYITRSYAPYDEGGGALMRKWTVGYLTSLGWDVQVIRPSYEKDVFSRKKMLSVYLLIKNIDRNGFLYSSVLVGTKII
tara:strand:- start:338 stop:619 length:282 start_codon:yes stop_codon:yes gene_type:complete